MNGYTFTSPPSPCLYLPEQIAELRYVVAPDLDQATYMRLLLGGWRRFGPALFSPECRSCTACRAVRVPVESFQPSESQRRAWRRNAGEVEIRNASPVSSPEKLALFAKFHQFGYETKGWPLDDEPDLDLFVNNPFSTEEWAYYLGGRLIAVGYVDALPEGLSAIYFYWDPDERRRSLGTFNILAMIAAARERRLPHVYLGYYVEGCRSLEYKGKFRPNEILSDRRWERFRA